MDKYKDPIHIELEETAKKVGGHGGMDFIMDYRLACACRMDCHWIWTFMTWQNGVAWLNLPDFLSRTIQLR